MRTGFKPSELKLDYLSFDKLARAVLLNHPVEDDLKKWVLAWHAWDLACSPMPDEERSLIRYGHYLGWCDKEKEQADG